jgi:flap endonuclease-1
LLSNFARTTQFIELCILLGCDYLPSIHGVGPVKALSLLRKHRTLAALIPHLQEMHAKKLADPKKSGGIVVPDGWDWEGAKAMFLRPDVLPKGDVPEVSLARLVLSLQFIV